ncbi:MULTISPECIES: polysaccharide deacetylase family protein [Bradyrhizobium]|uniref:polysaccharide deacetylase family protein n=1 Tax=Bradyrhizobium TaxID=374 RepID=UPI000942F44D|nr:MULTISPECIES: polysaccharide deacetylase family protein [Bradyrhizobium]
MFGLARDKLTTILFHRFFFAEEPDVRSLDRLKRQCEWLRRHFTALSLDAATDALQTGRLPNRPLLITIDDAKVELLRVADIFAEFELPIAIFACVGWCAKESPDQDSLLARLVNELEWYRGPVRTIKTRKGSITVGAGALETAKAVDLILADRDGSELEAVLAGIADSFSHPRISCSWSELAGLKASGVAIGGHSVSHVNLAAASQLRLEFEISETRRLLESKVGRSDSFAYPYGMSNTFSASTTSQLSKQGFRYAFLTHSDFASHRTNPLQIPRIAMPDRPMSKAEFQIRVAGAGVIYRKLKQSKFSLGRQ